MCIAQGWYRWQRARYGSPKVVTWRIVTRLHVFWSGAHRYWKHVTHAVRSCVVKIGYSTRKNRLSCEGLHRNPCFRHISCQHTLFTVWTFLALFFIFWISWTQVGVHKNVKTSPQHSYSLMWPSCFPGSLTAIFGHFCDGLKCLCSRVVQKSDGANSCVVTRYLSTVKRGNFDRCEIKIISVFLKGFWDGYIIWSVA